ncbi:NAD(P)/FAD-dependent oxidoreductase [Halobacillus shinanisalinarum]|uniref:NAD(P)/FAD-dependent oxidoreductase n=1 Tax=Halobacillus shinanisalinarum TaxID=2932258 RepID=A0ABY4GUU1_9BACI|nr:NAD(P)/FAD-dependent oxidoreductase [Halobacillus shinanisalinarum]UOQ91726.1 NAD(P)/FAD-dependent oxidoreductase [Halobacillus shinanisalinarum]
MTAPMYDVVVVGGGPGGLSAALVLGRSRRKVVVIDEGNPRNGVTLKTHGYLTRDGIKPQELRNIAKQQLTEYSNVSCIEDVVEKVEQRDHIFKIWTLKGNMFLSRRVIMATGMVEELPDIPGIREVYGKSVFPCPYCDGWERRDDPLAVFGGEANAVDFTKLIYNWSKDLIVFTNGFPRFDDCQKQELIDYNILVIETPITKLQSNSGKLEKVIVQSGEVFQRTGGFLVNTGEKQASPIPMNLGIQKNERGGYESDGHGLTSVKGLYVIGDAKNAFVGIAGAAGEGYEAGVVINHELVLEDWNNQSDKKENEPRL